jgi:diketogulonate reductase-like aldo/keto reductase
MVRKGIYSSTYLHSNRGRHTKGSNVRYERLFDGTEIPVIGFGTYTLGGGLSADHTHDQEHIRIIQKAIQLGYRHIDTAQMYGGGHTEELVGEAMTSFNREDLFVTTKVRGGDLVYRKVHEALEQSLYKLKTDYVDLFLIHWPNPMVPLKSTFKAFNELVRGGKVRHCGVSNFSISQLEHARELSDTPIAANQVEFSVGHREPETNGMLQHCQAREIILTAYEPLGKGRLINNSVLREVGDRHGVSTARVALSWLLRKHKVITIPMTSKEEHLKDNLAAVELELDDEDMRILDRMV